MDERITTLGGAAYEMDAAEPGSTFTFGAEGWEAVDYVDPMDDWTLQSDGSFASPDGLTRTWRLGGPEPD